MTKLLALNTLTAYCNTLTKVLFPYKDAQLVAKMCRNAATKLLVVATILFAPVALLHAQSTPTSYEGWWYITNGNNSGYYLMPSVRGYGAEADDQPYVTTFKTGADLNSVWRIEKVAIGGNTYYRIIHNATGKYLTFNDAVPGANAVRLRFHLQTFATPTDATLFVIAKNSSNNGIGLRPKDYDGSTSQSHVWLDISSKNTDDYWNDNTDGCAGVYYKITEINKGAKFFLTSAPTTCATPVITHNNGTGQFAISYPIAAETTTIYYTTDGTNPLTSPTRATYTAPFGESGATVVRAVATRSGYQNSAEALLYAPNHPFVIKTSNAANQSYYIVPPIAEGNATYTYATTSNVPSPKMGWYFKPAGQFGGVQYYHIVNYATGKYMYCSGQKNSGNAITMKTLGEASTDERRFAFRLYQRDGYTLIVPHIFDNNAPTTGSNNMLHKQNGDNKKETLGLFSDNANGNPRWQIIATPASPKTLLANTLSSSSESTVYWKIQSSADKAYYLYPPTGTSHICTANKSGTGAEWIIEEAADASDWEPYYLIRNGTTGDYLYFRGTASQNNTFFAAPSSNPSADDGFKFIIVRTANASYQNSYHIIPKALKDEPDQTNIALNRNGTTLRTQNSRDVNASCWYFVQVANFVSPPAFAQEAYDAAVTLSCITSGATIYYTTDGSNPSSSSTRQIYTSAIVPTPNATTTIKACAVLGANTSAVVSTTIDLGMRPTGYYALHCNGTGYINVRGVDVALANDNNFQADNLFDKGNSIWVITDEGYLQNHYFYLNVANNRTLYLSDTPATRWILDDVAGSGKKHLYINNGTQNLYLCYNNGITLSATSTKYYSACPVSVTELDGGWTGPSTDAVTVQSPQQVSQLRHYFTQKISYSYIDDGGTTRSKASISRRVYATLQYISTTSAGKGSTWDISSNTIYNRSHAAEVNINATFAMLPADLLARALHPTATEKQIALTVKPPVFSPQDKHYLLFNLSNQSIRFPYDDAIPTGQPAKCNGTLAQLTWPENSALAWQIEADECGYVMFKNVNTGHYLYYDATDYANTDYGSAKLSPLDAADTRFKFMLYRWGVDGTYGDSVVLIIPYAKQFAVYAHGKRAAQIYCGMYADATNLVLSLSKPADNNNKWKFYPYEVEDSYRLRDNYTIGIPAAIKESNTRATVVVTGTYSFTAQSYHWLNIKGAPRNNTELQILGTGNYTNIAYDWTVIGLDGYTPTTSYTSTGANNSTFSLNIEALPADTLKGKLRVVAHVSTPESKSAAIEIDLYLAPDATGPSEGDFVLITNLGDITDPNGIYKLATDRPQGTPALGEQAFAGHLDGNGYTVAGLTAPLFASVSGNAVVCNINFDSVNISNHSGPTGVVAGTASGSASVYNIGVLGGTLSSSGYCGSIIGQLNDMARVVNCFSYASITGGTTVGGIVGYNNNTTNRSNIRTMVMNCVYYGDRIVGTNVSPIYGGTIINSNSDNNGINNYNYFAQSTSLEGNVVYNCALEMEQRYMNRFEFYRLLLNSNRELAGWYATGKVDKNHTVMAKWVLEAADRTIENPKPYPVLKPHGKHPSIINPDAAHAGIGAARNQGGKMGQLTVNIQMGSGNKFAAPTGAAITTATITLPITDKDTTRFNYNYYKVQLPYYNDLGTGNYTHNRTVAGWKIVNIVGGNAGNFTTGADATVDAEGNITATPYNFADRQCTSKDLYAISGRVFNQGAYWDVPDGVTAITIEPYWAQCSYLADAYYDVCYSAGYGATNFTLPGMHYSNNYTYTINGNPQKVYTNSADALNALGREAGTTVYDYALVLVGNYHHRTKYFSNDKLPYTYTSIDLDGDNEPDYADVCQTDSRESMSPMRIDFLNSIGLGMALKPNGSTQMAGWGIPFTKGWFEVTNTTLLRFTEFEYDGNNDKTEAPVILQGGIYEQFVSMKLNGAASTRTPYLIVGGNAWFAMFNNGSHGNNTDGVYTRHTPVNVLGGDYECFYLTGMFNTKAKTQANDNAECYIRGGRFGELAGTGVEGVGGNVVWLIYGADIANFYGGGTNVLKPVEGNIVVDIANSHVNTYCGGPKFGDMRPGMTVTTTATRCHFGTYFGAGYGGTAYNAPRLYDRNPDYNYNYNYNDFIRLHYNRGYRTSYGSSAADQKDAVPCNGISTDYEYELFAPPGFTRPNNVCRFRIRYASLSLATTHSVVSRLTGCTITGNYYGGGNLGLVEGSVSSTLTSDTVYGNVYGAGFSAQAPTCPVMPKYDEGKYQPEPFYNTATGAYSAGVKTVGGVPSNGILYTWHQVQEVITDGSQVFDEANRYIFTNVDMSNLGVVSSNATLLINGQSYIGLPGSPSSADSGNVFGGGNESAVEGNTQVVIGGNTEVSGSVYGGGRLGNVKGNATVSISQ